MTEKKTNNSTYAYQLNVYKFIVYIIGKTAIVFQFNGFSL